MGLPPVEGAVHDTEAVALPAVALTFVGAPGGVGCELVTVTSSTYMLVSSAGTAPSWWTLNQRLTVCPAYAVRLKVTWVHVCELLLLLKTEASVAPAALRISAC